MAEPFGPRRPSWIEQREMAHFSQFQPGMIPLNSPPAVNMYVNAVYYPNWSFYKQVFPSSLNIGAISHIFYAFAWVKPDGTVYLSDEWADTQVAVDDTHGCLRSLSRLKQQRQTLKVILSIGGGGTGSEHFAAVTKSNTASNTFARSARELCLKYNLDGIDIDWEYPMDVEQGRNYANLLAIVRSYLPRPRFTITSALPAGQWALRNIDLSSAHDYLDFICLMAYDFSGPWTKTTGHQSQLHNADRAANEYSGVSCHSGVSYLISQDVPEHKILLGIPAYGRSFLGANNIDQRYTGHGGDEGCFQFKTLPRPGTRELVDLRCGAAFCSGGDGGFVTYDTPDTVKLKAQYVKYHGLAGLFYWSVLGDADGRRSLVTNGFQALHTID